MIITVVKVVTTTEVSMTIDNKANEAPKRKEVSSLFVMLTDLITAHTVDIAMKEKVKTNSAC